MEVKWNACCFKLRFGFCNKLHFNGQFKVHLIPNKLQTLGKRKEGKQAGKLQRNSPQGCLLELVSKELNHLAAILHVYAGGLNFMK